MLALENIQCAYGKKNVIHGIDLHVNKAEVVSILGANGSGKSTLLKAIVGLLPYSGAIRIQSTLVEKLKRVERAALIAYVPQMSSIPFDFSVLEVVLMGRFHTSSFGFNYAKEDKDLAYRSLEKVGMSAFSKQAFKNLSGGERQLVLIARALAQQSSIIVMDEPVTGLDLGNQMRLLDLISTLAQEGYTILQTTHYPDHALRVSHKVAWIAHGKMLAYGEPQEVVTVERILEVYGVASEMFQHTSGVHHLLPLGFLPKECLCGLS